MSEEITPFHIEIADADLVDLRDRLRRTGGPNRRRWQTGHRACPWAISRSSVATGPRNYQWRVRERGLNRFPQYRTTIDGLDIHFLHVRSPEPDAFPVVLTHGWPGSVVEFMDVVGPLTDPVAHGGTAARRVPPGGPIPAPGSVSATGRPRPAGDGNGSRYAWATLMARLGYDRYGAQGGDWAPASAPISAPGIPSTWPASTSISSSSRRIRTRRSSPQKSR